MSDETPIEKTLKEILQTQSFDKLGSFSDQEAWGSFTEQERTLLARLFILAAESELKTQSSSDPVAAAKKSFHMASALAPDDANIWLRRGLAFAAQDAEPLLEESSVCLEKAVALNGEFFDAHYGWANVLMRRGMVSGDASYFIQAERAFSKAETLLKDPLFNDDFFWHSGLNYFLMARHSGEAIDLHKAICYYRKAKGQGLQRPDFFNDFANALVELSLLINCQDLMFEAIELYLHSLDNQDEALNAPRDIAVRLCNLGACYQYLFEIHHEETFFKQAADCFKQATDLQPQFTNPWAFWGYLLLYAAKLWQDVHLLEECLEKLSQMSDYADDKPLLLARMSEAFSLYGSHEEELKFLNDALEMSEAAILEGPEVPIAYASCALSYLELGRYFGEAFYFNRAIENAERAIALHSKIGLAWHVLAVSKLSLGEAQNNLRLLEEANAAFDVASKTDVGRFGYMWNDWGIALLNIADITYDKKYIQEAIECFEMAILLHEPVHPAWLVNYGTALDFWGDITGDESFYEKAIEVLQHAITMDSGNLYGHYHLGLALCHMGEHTQDLAYLQKGIEELQIVLHEDMEDENGWCDLGMAYMHVAELTHEPKNCEVKESLHLLAEQHFLQSLSLGNEHVCYHLACLYSLQENGTDAFHYLLKAHECNTLPPLAEVCEDRWLEYVRSTPYFQQFLERAKRY